MAAAVEDLRPAQARSEGQRDLAELQQIRDALLKDRVATTNRGKHLRTPVGKRLTRQRLKQIKRQLKVIDAEIRQRLEAEEALERRAEILTSIPGISDITAAGLIIHMPELGTLTGARAASLAGLAPITRESGYWKGRGFNPGRQAPVAPAALHARAGRGPVQSRPQAEVRGARGQGETAEGRPDGGDAEAPRSRQHAGAAGPDLDGACAQRMLQLRLPDAPPRGERSRMIEPGKSGHRNGGVAKERREARVYAASTGIHLTWILPSPPSAARPATHGRAAEA